MSTEDLPKWVVPGMHGFRARLAAIPDDVRQSWYVIEGLIWTLLAGASVLGGLVGLVALVNGASWVLLGLLAVWVATPLFAGLGLRALLNLTVYHDPVFEVSLHDFTYNQRRLGLWGYGRFWELPLSSLSGARVEGAELVVSRQGAEALRFPAAGVNASELGWFAWRLDSLIREADGVEAAPPELVALREPAAPGAALRGRSEQRNGS